MKVMISDSATAISLRLWLHLRMNEAVWEELVAEPVKERERERERELIYFLK